MWLTLIVLPDGTEIFSGPGSGPKVQNATIKQMVNDAERCRIASAMNPMGGHHEETKFGKHDHAAA